MFGALRTILAIMVLIGHLTDQWQIGTYAVFAFYIISGYLMTLIMQQSYGYSARGRSMFALNRFLRLYPVYWVCLLLSIAAVFFVGEGFAKNYNKLMQLPGSLIEGLRISSMLYIDLFPNKVSPNLVPTTWAITVELFFYGLICLGLSKTKLRVQLWLFCSIAYTVYCHIANLPWSYKYFPVTAASLPFAIGAYIYFLKQDGYRSISGSWVTSPAMLSVLLLVNAGAVLFYPAFFQTGFYNSLFLSILLCYEIAMGRGWPLLSKKMDRTIGDYSYPIYLLHWQVGMVVAFVLYGKPIKSLDVPGLTITAATLLLVVAIAYLLQRWVAGPLEGRRRDIKARVVRV